jgi:hypothetical protein
LQDSRFEALTRPDTWELLDEYFLETPLPTGEDTENWPILGVSYRLFRLVVKIAKLRRRTPLNEQDLDAARKMGTTLARWVVLVNISRSSSIGTLYVLVAKTVLQHILWNQMRSSQLAGVLALDVRRAVAFLARIEVQPHYVKYLVWPVSALQAVATDETDKEYIDQKMEEVISRRNIHGGWST